MSSGELHPALQTLIWLIGVWEGPGYTAAAVEGEDPDPAFLSVLVEPAEGAQLEVHLGIRAMGPDGEPAQELGRETGWLRVVTTTGERTADLELLVAHERGFVEVSVGTVEGAKIQLVSDVVLSTPTGTQIAAVSRLMGIHNSQLLVATDEGTGDGVHSRYWGQLDRRPGTGWT